MFENITNFTENLLWFVQRYETNENVVRTSSEILQILFKKKKKKRKKNIHDIWKIRRVSGKGGKSWFMDHRLSRDVVDLASYRAKGRSPFLTLRGVFPLCTPVSSRGAKGWWRQEGQQCCQTPSISVSTFLSSSPHLFLPAFSTVWFLFLSRTRVSYTRSPRTPPLFFLSLRPYSKCFPSKPTLFFPLQVSAPRFPFLAFLLLA